MKTQQEIVIYAVNYAKSIGNEDGTAAFDYAKGYNQCQEDMADEMEKCVRFFLKHTQRQITDRIAKESPKDFDVAKEVVKFYINSLNKQD